jgi:hypothetical protein
VNPEVPCSNYRATVVSDTTVPPPPSCADPVGPSCEQPDSTYPVDGIGLYLRNGVFCGNPATASDYVNSYQADEIAPVPGESFSISCLEVAIANFDGENSFQIQLWDDTDGGAPTGFGADLIALSDQLCVQSAGPGMYSVPLPSPVEVAAGSTLCISMSHGTGNGNSVITYGMTIDPDSAPGQDLRPWTTYLNMPTCGLAFQSVDAVGFTGYDWDVQINFGGDVSLPCPTDLDEDGDTDFNDILIVLSNWGTDGAAGGDSDENGTVDFNDLILLLSAFGPCP